MDELPALSENCAKVIPELPYFFGCVTDFYVSLSNRSGCIKEVTVEDSMFYTFHPDCKFVGRACVVRVCLHNPMQML